METKIKINEELTAYAVMTDNGHDIELIFCDTPWTKYDAENQTLTLLNDTDMPDFSVFAELYTVSKSLKNELRVFMNDHEFVVTNKAKTKVLFYALVEHEYLQQSATGYPYGVDYGYILYDFAIDCLPFKMAKSMEVYTELFDV